MGQVIPFITRVSASGDWTADERARLAELGERLAAAGLRVEVIYGSTEDGDPWCVVKDDNEEVLIHVARIGGAFVIHYAFDDSLRQGDDLPAILGERLAWEETRGVVTPFSRQAQSLLVLIVATAFFYESARHGGDGPHFIGPSGHDAGEDALAAQPPAGHLADEALIAAQALHAPAATVAMAGADLPSAASPEWRSFAFDDDALGRADHGGRELSLAKFAPGAALPMIANLDVAAPAAASPVVVAFDDHVRAGPDPGAALSQTMTVERVSDPHGPVTASFRPTNPEPQPKTPDTESHPAVVSAHWVEVDLDGDGRPDVRIAVPDETKPSPKAPEPTHLVLPDHEAVIAVGHGFEHSLIA